METEEKPKKNLFGVVAENLAISFAVDDAVADFEYRRREVHNNLLRAFKETEEIEKRLGLPGSLAKVQEHMEQAYNELWLLRLKVKVNGVEVEGYV